MSEEKSDNPRVRYLRRRGRDCGATEKLAKSLTGRSLLSATEQAKKERVWRKWLKMPVRMWNEWREQCRDVQAAERTGLGAFYIPFRGVMEKGSDGVIYIGRRYPLWREKEVRRLMHGCLGRGHSELKNKALQIYRDLRDRNGPCNEVLIEMDDFDQYLIRRHLPALERKVKQGFRPIPKARDRFANRALSVYDDLPDAMKVVMLYLAYPLVPRQWSRLRRLVQTLDWKYLAELFDNPCMAANWRERATVRYIRSKLSGEARSAVKAALEQQPVVGHRVLAEEYAQITGQSTQRAPSYNIQRRMLEYRDGEADGLSAICLSGGGIRSASFCLGALQELAAHRLFGRFHYLSTVSGGGYIGTALTRWMTAKIQDDGMSPSQALEFAEAELKRLRSADYVQGRMTGVQFDQEGPLTWLRMNSNYLARQLSLFSADAWTIVATYLRNLVIVWSIFLPWIAVYLLLPWAAVWCAQYRLVAPVIIFDDWLKSTVLIVLAWTGVSFVGEWVSHAISWIANLFGATDALHDFLARMHVATEDLTFVALLLSVLGSAIGVFGASYFYQGKPGANETRAANRVKWPSLVGDTRAAFGALLLIIACFALSVAMWSDVDEPPSRPEFDLLFVLWRYGYVLLAIFATQMVLARFNVDANTHRSRMTMFGAGLLASVIQAALILWIRWGLQHWQPEPPHEGQLTLGTTVRALATPPLMIVALLLGEGMKAAIRSYAEPPARREHQARAHAFSFMLITAWIVGAVMVIGVPAVLTYLGESTPAVTAAGSAVSVAVSAWFGYRKSSPGKPEAKTPISLSLIGSAGMALFAALISIGAWKAFEHLTTPSDWPRPARCECSGLAVSQISKFEKARYASEGFHRPVDESMCKIPALQCVDRPFTLYFDELLSSFDASELGYMLGILFFAGAACLGLGFVIRMNEFSLHGFYRDRLIRAFYGGFRGYRKPRKATLFTGFDTNDDVCFNLVESLYEDPVAGNERGSRPRKPPFLLVNTALNLVKGDELAWQERKADSFTFTSLHGGNYRLGYRCIKEFAQGVKLGTAMAISGAAFNPNMGYNSSAPMAFLMSVLNVRLGWWLGNPRGVKWKKKDPSSSSWRLLQEAAGETTDTGDWIHLSDGGHFDNLGLWEMVHRRCRRILVIDASQDTRFALEDLYTAIRKIRIDMGVEIRADGAPVLLFPRSIRAAGLCHARFTIRYPEANEGEACDRLNGVLLYLKPCLYGTEPPDIQEYAEKHPEFPHESTADQFFNESQFESYRKLGEWEMQQLLLYALQEKDVGDIPDDVPFDAKSSKQRGLFS